MTLNTRNTYLLVGAAAALLFVPWLGETSFYTKGEPREAIVAVDMLASGNWILPAGTGGDIPYKPPLLAWLISIFSLIFNGGHVSEFTSRLPSALAAVGMLMGVWGAANNHLGQRRAWMVMLVTATSFEVMRAATACRVDMLLTACMVGAILSMWRMRGRPVMWLTSIVLLSGAVLAKGPVGALLPCLAVGIAMLLDRRGFWATLWRLTLVCLISFVIPAMWYYAAWEQAGDAFASLAWEENIGRLTGTMSYDSHINPWWYNFTSLAAGMLPWTLPVLIAFALRPVRQAARATHPWHGNSLLCWTVTLTVIIFYCIPASKRSVYILPVYPFVAYGAAWVLEKISGSVLMRVWCYFLITVCILAPCVFVIAQTGLLRADALSPVLSTVYWWVWPTALLPAGLALWALFTRRAAALTSGMAVALTYVLVLAYNSAYMPMALNARSDKPAAKKIEATVPSDAEIYSVIPQDRLLRYYTMNFYLGDRIIPTQSADSVPATVWFIAEPDSISDPSRRAIPLTRRSCDTRRPAALFAPAK